MIAGFVLVSMVSSMAIADVADKKTAPPRENVIRILLVTGGHDFDREPFLAMFQDQPDITVQHVEHPNVHDFFAPNKADTYDVMVWYDMYKPISETARKNLQQLIKNGKPLVALHHALANYRDWTGIFDILGGHVFMKKDGSPTDFSYTHGVDYTITPANKNHPILKGVTPFKINDETYKGYDVLPTVTPLLTTDHPKSGKLVGWTHRYGKGNVVYLANGHDAHAYNNPNYRRLVMQSIRWVAGFLPDPSEEGFVSLFDGKTLIGWHKMGKPEGFYVKDGAICSEPKAGGFWLRSDRQYADFVLRFQYRIGKQGNAGVFFRSSEKGYPWDSGIEAQITHERRDEWHCTGALYSFVPADPVPVEKPNVWHDYEVVCRGPYIKVFVDNLPVIDVDQRNVPAIKNRQLKGYVGFQDAHNPKGKVEFRRIRIKELKQTDQIVQ